MDTEAPRSADRPDRFVADGAFDIIAMCASAGGFNAFRLVLTALPEAFPAAIVVVQHLDPKHVSKMAELLTRRSEIDIREAPQGGVLAAGCAQIAPPDHHLLVNPDGTLLLTQTELVHFVRPSADLLFESVAASYRERAVAVVLSGTGSDGATGVEAIKKMGGTVIVQDEGSSEFFGMPKAAAATGSADMILPLEEIAPALVRLVTPKQAR